MGKLHLILLNGGFALGLISVICGWFLIPYAVQDHIKDQVQIKNGSETFLKWSVVSTPIYYSVRLFNVTNPKEIEKGGKPNLVEVGPYVYQERREKFDIDWNFDETVIKYRQKVEYFFRPDLSNGTENDRLTFLNVPLAAASAKFKELPTIVLSMIEMTLSEYNETLFINRSVEELLFKGYHSPWTVYMEKLSGEKILINETFGLLYPKNGTDDGEYQMFTGVGDYNQFGKIISWENKTQLDYWPNSTYCNMINGTDGSIFPPFVTRDRVLRIFANEMCRSAYLTYEKDSEFEGIPTFRFSFPKSFLENSISNEDNKCYCLQMENGEEICQKTGTHSLAACRKGAPIIISFPHFYNGDEDLVKAVKGLKPNYHDHSTFMEIEPTSGLFLKVKSRVQINIELKKIKSLRQFKKLSSKMVFPLIWIEESVTMGDDVTEMIKGQLLLTLNITKYAKWLGLCIGMLLFLVGLLGVTFNKFDKMYKVNV